MKQTFLEFLTEEAKKPKPPKPRPKKNLWFNNPDFWHQDLYIEKGNDLKFHEDEEANVYATDMNGEQCFGYWEKAKNGGMTFFKPRPFSHYQHRRSMKALSESVEQDPFSSLQDAKKHLNKKRDPLDYVILQNKKTGRFRVHGHMAWSAWNEHQRDKYKVVG